MFKYAFSDYFWLYLLAIAFWSIVFAIIHVCNKSILKNNLYYFLLLAISFSFLGLTIGILIGLSESPVIGLIIPALLTFFGGFIIYAFVFAAKKSVQDGYVLLIILLCVSFFLMLGSDYGGRIRCEYDAQETEYKYYQKKDFELFKHNLSLQNGPTEGPVAIADTSTKNLFNTIIKNSARTK
ncbi:MAG TPA: hypothetical protein VK668_20230 [Mucilaginibacter sp.]|nr:hypothetical protein [Mucilaginibacter sp.]